MTEVSAKFGEGPASESGPTTAGKTQEPTCNGGMCGALEEDTLGGAIGVDCVREAEMDEQSAEQEDEECEYAAFGSGGTSG